MKQKYPKCENCGANDYETDWMKPFIKCSYCGTEYETSEKQNSHVVSHRLMPLDINANWERIEYDYKADETRRYDERGKLISIDKPKWYDKKDYLTQEEMLAMGVQPKGFFNEVASGISEVGGMFDCLKSLFG